MQPSTLSFRRALRRSASFALLAAAALSASACVTRTVYVVDDRDRDRGVEVDRPAPAPAPAPAVAVASSGGGVVAYEDSAGIVDNSDFYAPLSPYGTWFYYPSYGYVWRPSVAVVGSSFRPYTHGHWEHTEWGWTWVDHHPFGWATGHYGRWLYDSSYGWVWVPGTQWSPAWVTWRTGGGYVGWAAMPPGAVYGGSYAVYDTSYVFVTTGNFGVTYVGGVLIGGPVYRTCYMSTYDTRTTTVIYGRPYYRGPDYDEVRRSGTVIHRPLRETERDRAVSRPPSGTSIARGRDRDRDPTRDYGDGRDRSGSAGRGRDRDTDNSGRDSDSRDRGNDASNDRDRDVSNDRGTSRDRNDVVVVEPGDDRGDNRGDDRDGRDDSRGSGGDRGNGRGRTDPRGFTPRGDDNALPADVDVREDPRGRSPAVDPGVDDDRGVGRDGRDPGRGSNDGRVRDRAPVVPVTDPLGPVGGDDDDRGGAPEVKPPKKSYLDDPRTFEERTDVNNERPVAVDRPSPRPVEAPSVNPGRVRPTNPYDRVDDRSSRPLPDRTPTVERPSYGGLDRTPSVTRPANPTNPQLNTGRNRTPTVQPTQPAQPTQPTAEQPSSSKKKKSTTSSKKPVTRH